MAVKMTQQEWGTKKGWSPDYIPSKEEMAEYQAYLDTPVQEEDASEQDLDLVDENSKPDDGNITKNSLSIAQQRMRGLVNRPSYSDFEKMLGSYVNEDGNLSRRDRRDFRKALKEQGINMSRSQMRRIGRSFNRGETNGAFNNYVNSRERNSYIENGKLYIQGQDGYTDEGFKAATRKGTDATALVNQYNQDVINARKNAKIVYDPVTNTYKASGKVGDIEFTDQDITNADWFKNDVDRQRTAQQQSYFNAVNDYNNQDILSKYSNKNLAETLGLDISGYNAYNDEDKLKFRKDATRTLFEHLDRMRNNQGFNGSIQADAIMKLLINNQNTSALPWLGKLEWNNGGTYGQILQGQKHKEAYGLLAKEGAVMNYIRKHASGGKSENKYIGVNRNFSKSGWFGQERFSPDENMFGWNEEYLNGHYRYSTPDPNVNLFVNKNNGNVYLQDLDKYNQYKLGQHIGNVNGAITDDGLYEVYMNYFTKHPTIPNRTASKKEPEKRPLNTNPSPAKQGKKPEYKAHKAYKAYKSRYSDDYNSKHYYATYKNGGLLNMNKINYFQEGGAMAPQAAPTATPAQGGQDIQAQVMQLVQAAMNGDEQATQAIQQIMQAAQQGDQQAVQIAQMIQDVAKQMQGQATAAKYGAKLSYIKSLKSGCPEGYEVSYHKKGGVLCKECVAKSNIATSQPINNATESVVTSAYNYTVNRVNNTISGLQKQPQNETASSDITSLHKKGGCLKKKLSCGKKMQEGSKVDEAKCGTKIKAACGTKTTINKCGSKLKKKLSCGKKMQEGDKINEAKCGSKMKAACGTKATMDKCGGKAKKKCLNGAEIMEDKCGGKATKKKCLDGAKVIEDKCGGKAKKKCLNGGFLTLENLQSAYKFANGGTILKAWSGNVLRADHVKDGLYKEERAKEEAQWNKYATASEAIKAAKEANRSWFGYKGKVYRTGAANDWANPGEIERMTQLYGANLGWTDDLKKLNGEQGKKAAEYRRNSRNQTANLSDNVTPVPAERPQRGKATERVAINSYVNPQKTEINWDFFMLPGQKTTNKQIAYRSGANKAWGDYIRKNSPNLYGKFFDSMIKAGYSYIPSSGTYVNKSGDRVFLSDGRLYSSNNRTGRRNINIRNLNLK